MAAGRIEVTLDEEPGPEGRVVTLIITPQQWAALREAGWYEYGGIGEALGVLDDDERFVIYRDGGLVRSIREEMPLVRGTATLRRIAAARKAKPGGQTVWLAYKPHSDREA